MKWAVRLVGDLGDGFAFAPERHVLRAGADGGAGESVALEDLVLERNERVTLRDMESARASLVVLDTTHARDGVLDVESARLASAAEAARSTKKRARPGDLLVSRLRPYLRQIALVHPAALGDPEPLLAVSTEFYVLAPKATGKGKAMGAGKANNDADLAWILPWLLSHDVQSALAAAQEGGHHPRVPRPSLFALRVPLSLVRTKRRTSTRVTDALEGAYAATARLREALGR